MDLKDALATEVQRRSLIQMGTRGAVAFSGGADSLCLLSVLAELRAALSIELVALHIDHGLRAGSASDARDAVFLAGKLNVEVEVLHAPKFDADCGNKQQWAREARRSLLQTFAADTGLSWIATAHNADDQAETVLMRVLRGSGLRGLGGMRWKNGIFVRPFLGVERGEIETYLAQKGLRPVEDPTNATDLFLRNRLRRQILPLLKKENPALVATLCRLAKNCQEEEEALAALTGDIYQGLNDGGGLSVAGLRALSTAMQHRVIAEAFFRVQGNRRHLDRCHLEDVAALLVSGAGSQSVSLPGLVAERRYETLVFSAREARQPALPTLQTLEIPGPGRYELSDGSLVVIEKAAPDSGAAGQCLKSVVWPLTVRATQPGDRIAVGLGQSTKIAKLLQDRKIPRAQRAGVPVLVMGNEVISVVGVRVAFGWVPQGPTETLRIYRVAAAERTDIR